LSSGHDGSEEVDVSVFAGAGTSAGASDVGLTSVVGSPMGSGAGVEVVAAVSEASGFWEAAVGSTGAVSSVADIVGVDRLDK